MTKIAPQPYSKNPRKITDPQLASLESTLEELGDLGGVVHDLNSNQLVGGNQRDKVFRLSDCEIEIVKTFDPPTPQGTVALGYVVWRGERYAYRQVRYTPEQFQRANIVANAAGGSWDWSILKSEFDASMLAENGLNADALASSQADSAGLAEMLSEVSPPAEETADAGELIDRAAELQKKWQVKRGDLWQCGRHRILCGDSTNADDVARVMGGEKAVMSFIDPPYNALKSWKKDESHGETRLDPSKWFQNDNMEWDDYDAFLRLAFANLQGHSVYVCCDYRIYPRLTKLVKDAGYDLKHCIVWKKNFWGLGKRYRFQHEFIIYACKGDAPFYGGHDESDVWEENSVRSEHNTPKPVGLPRRAMSNSSKQYDMVFDGFVGSGTSIVAAENLGRICYGLEIEPRYVSLSLERLSLLGLDCNRIESAA